MSIRFLSFFLFLVAAAFKDDAADLAGSEFWSELAHTPLVAALKSASGAITICAFLLAMAAIVRRFELRLHLFVGFVVYSMIAVIRASVLDLALGAKLFVGFCFSAAIYFSVRSASHHFGLKRTVMLYANATALFSATLIAANAFEFVQGFGFVEENPRMFGTSGHPNFLGVQLACAIMSLASMATLTKKIRTIAVVTLCACGLFFLYETGSRTGIVVLASGALLMLQSKLRLSSSAVLAVAGLVAALMASIPDLTAFGDVFSRDDQDTRSEAWSALISIIVQDPIFGVGYVDEPSENSFLRGWASYGIGYAGVFLITVVWALLRMAQYSNRDGAESLSPFVGLLAGLIAGSMLEGYLMDAFSVALLLYIVSLSLLDAVAETSARGEERQTAPEAVNACESAATV